MVTTFGRGGIPAVGDTEELLGSLGVGRKLDQAGLNLKFKKKKYLRHEIVRKLTI